VGSNKEGVSMPGSEWSEGRREMQVTLQPRLRILIEYQMIGTREWEQYELEPTEYYDPAYGEGNWKLDDL
jgi:hypothetical protein